MRVNISYSIELADVPDRVISFLEESQDKVTEAEELLANAIENISSKNCVRALEDIKTYREAMGSIDYRLEDCMHILSGYSKALTDLAHPPPQAGVPQPASPQAEQVEWVQKELEKLQEKRNGSKPKSGDGG